MERRAGYPEVVLKMEEGRQLMDVAATMTDGKRSDVEELSSDASGFGVHGKGFALGNHPLRKTRPRAQDDRVETVPLVRGRQKGEAERWSESSESVENFEG